MGAGDIGLLAVGVIATGIIIWDTRGKIGGLMLAGTLDALIIAVVAMY